MDKFSALQNYVITDTCIPVMIKGLENSTRFRIKMNEWVGNPTISDFYARRFYDQDAQLYEVKVTNDERRRLLRVLSGLNNIKIK